MSPLKEAFLPGLIFCLNIQISEILLVVAIKPTALYIDIYLYIFLQLCCKYLENKEPALVFLVPSAAWQCLEHSIHSLW